VLKLNGKDDSNREESMRKYILFIFVFLALLSFGLPAESVREKTKEANELYQGEKYDQALTKYQDALLSDPENKRLQFNVGNALYQKKKYEEALKEYQKVIGTEKLLLEGQTYYNLGNALYRLNKLPESIMAYQQALKINPDDMDAKYNLEYVRRKLKQNSEKQETNEQQEQQSTQEQQQQHQQDQDQSENNEAQKQHEDKDQTEQIQPQDQKELSKEEAEKILDALKNDEKDSQKKRKMHVSGRPRIKKDW